MFPNPTVPEDAPARDELDANGHSIACNRSRRMPNGPCACGNACSKCADSYRGLRAAGLTLAPRPQQETEVRIALVPRTRVIQMDLTHRPGGVEV